eukprot:scaffold2028_cov353-Pavlova_lutheri.AAC.8
MDVSFMGQWAFPPHWQVGYWVFRSRIRSDGDTSDRTNKTLTLLSGESGSPSSPSTNGRGRPSITVLVDGSVE